MRQLFWFLVIFSLSTMKVFAETPPPANVPNPVPDANNPVILAFWSQIISGQVDSKTPELEGRYVVFVDPAIFTSDKTLWDAVAMTACATTDLAGKAPNASITTRGAMEGSMRAPDGNGGYKHTQIKYLIAICSAKLDATAAHVSVVANGAASTPLNLYPHGKPATIAGPSVFGKRDQVGKEISAVVIGDTGCRGEDPGERKTGERKKRFRQNCKNTGIDSNGKPTDDTDYWPFIHLVKTAALLNPDFVIHVGDNHYFWERNSFWAYGVGLNDRFEYWLQEFLNPSQELLLTAPFVFVRGNHEICDPSWFGSGWFMLFAPDGQYYCQPNSKTWSFDVGPKNNAALDPYRFYVVDTSDPWSAKSADAFKEASQEDIGKMNKAWLSHYPPAKLVYYNSQFHIGDKGAIEATSDAIGNCTGGDACIPELTFAGHQHLLQKLDIKKPNSSDYFTQVYVVGNGGTRLDASGLKYPHAASVTSILQCNHDFADGSRDNPSTGVFNQPKLTANVSTFSRHGFLHIKRGAKESNIKGKSWSVTPYWYALKSPAATAGSFADPCKY